MIWLANATLDCCSDSCAIYHAQIGIIVLSYYKVCAFLGLVVSITPCVVCGLGSNPTTFFCIFSYECILFNYRNVYNTFNNDIFVLRLNFIFPFLCGQTLKDVMPLQFFFLIIIQVKFAFFSFLYNKLYLSIVKYVVDIYLLLVSYILHYRMEQKQPMLIILNH